MSKWCNGHETDVASYNLDRNVSCKVFEINMNLFAVYLLNGSMKWDFILIHFIRKSVKKYLFKRLSINEICSKASYLSSFSTGSCIWNIKKTSLWFRFCIIKDFLPFNIRHRKHRSGSFFVFLVDKKKIEDTKNSEFFYLHLAVAFFLWIIKRFIFSKKVYVHFGNFTHSKYRRPIALYNMKRNAFMVSIRSCQYKSKSICLIGPGPPLIFLIMLGFKAGTRPNISAKSFIPMVDAGAAVDGMHAILKISKITRPYWQTIKHNDGSSD